MAVIILLCLAILTQVSCDKHSLTFVIDDTYSLIDDIKQVINATKLIVGFENASDIEDYVLVTFNDPEIVLKKKTQNPKELIEALDSIKVHNGSTTVCPEAALSGLKLALNESREGSRFYVFTDSSARDYDKFEEVKALCQAKKSQIYFIVSGHCGDISTRRYQVYQKLAAACKGQAITVDKDDIAQVPVYLKKIIKGNRNVIESVVIPANKWSNTSEFNIDVLTEKTIISASGIDVDLVITTAGNVVIKRVNETWTRNFKVFEPTRLRGIYKVKVRGNSPVEVKIMARSNFTFEYGFAMENVTAVKETDPHPFTDIKTRLTIFAKDPEGSVEVKGVELHDGKKKVPLPLTRVADNVYATEEFLSPEQPFRIAVVAIAKKSKKTVKSFAKTLVTPVDPGSVEQIKVKQGASIDVHCRTPSNITKAQITWYEKTTKEGNFSVIKLQTKEVLHVDKPVDKVYYKCLARNATGTDQYNGQIDIQVQPEFIYPPSVILTNINDPATIECKIFKGNPRPKITWEFKRVDATKYEQFSNQNDTYNLLLAQLEDSGDYRCFANSTAGSAEKITKLVVQVVPEVLKSNDEFTVKEGTSTDVECSILNGIPKPEITWYAKQQDATEFEEIVDEKNETLHVTRAKISKTYKCEAKNSAGNDSNTVKIYVEARPEFKFTTPKVTVKEGDPVAIDCKLRKGSPPLERSWERKFKDMTFSTLKHEGEELNIIAAQLTHAGDYKCVAENSEGRAEKVTELIVQVVPSIEDVAYNKTALENSNVIIQCRISKGFPKPTVNWFYKGPALPDFVNMSKTGETLLLENVPVTFSGQYKCVAENEIGRAEKIVQLEVNDHIESSKANKIYAPFTKPYYIKCSLPYLDPSSIKWYKNSKLMADRTGPLLYIDDPTEFDSGNYTCRVSGLADSASHTAQVIFGQSPKRNQTLHNVEWEGDEISLPCYSSEYPEGQYEWFYNGKKTGWNSKTIKVADWGEYICNVKNPLGNLVITYNVTFKGCRVLKSLFTSEHAPLVLDSSLSWPLLRTAHEHFIVPRSEKLLLICQDDSNTITKNSFTKFPNVKSVYAACETGDSFTVDGNIRKISEFECKQKVMPGAIQTKLPCLGNDTELVQVGFSVDVFTEVYQSCMDLKKMVPLYTKMNTIPVQREYVYVSDESTEDICEHESECCYESIQLVNGIDVSFGPAKSATHIYALNSVNYCKLKDDFDWYSIEMILRSEIQYTVWTGAAQYMEVDIDGKTKDVPRYLWKVVLDYSGSDKEIVVIIHENVDNPGPQLCAGACGIKTTFFKPSGHRTYCCNLDDFKKALGVDLDIGL